MTKRRVFDIDFPVDDPPAVPAGTSAPDRRGPMASAIAENAEALSERQTAEAAIRAENDRLAHEHVEAKKQGLITALVPIFKIETDKLTRDRKAVRDPEIDELKASIREIGLSNPIRVQETEEGYELIQGYRRLTAYGELYDDTGEEKYKYIPAGLVVRSERIDKLYRRMVDENMVRKGISFGEMAALAWAYVRDGSIQIQNIDEAIDALYASAGRQKRAYIKSFAKMLRKLEGALVHIDVIPRALGLDLAKKLQSEPGAVAELRARLEADPGRSAGEELSLLRSFVSEKPKAPVKARKTAKTTFRVSRPEGPAKCTASDGKVELSLPRDFSVVDRHRLEAAVTAFFDALDA